RDLVDSLAVDAKAVPQEIAEALQRVLRDGGVAPNEAEQGMEGVQDEVRVQLASHGLELSPGAQRFRAIRPRRLLAPRRGVLPGVREAGERAVDEHVVQHAERDDARRDLDSELAFECQGVE